MPKVHRRETTATLLQEVGIGGASRFSGLASVMKHSIVSLDVNPQLKDDKQLGWTLLGPRRASGLIVAQIPFPTLQLPRRGEPRAPPHTGLLATQVSPELQVSGSRGSLFCATAGSQKGGSYGTSSRAGANYGVRADFTPSRLRTPATLRASSVPIVKTTTSTEGKSDDGHGPWPALIVGDSCRAPAENIASPAVQLWVN